MWVVFASWFEVCGGLVVARDRLGVKVVIWEHVVGCFSEVGDVWRALYGFNVGKFGTKIRKCSETSPCPGCQATRGGDSLKALNRLDC